jgi:hypothetical protein
MTLNEIAARWLGLEPTYFDRYLDTKEKKAIKFDPLHDRNDLVRVEEKIPYEITIRGNRFWINSEETIYGTPLKKGRYPADYSKAILELVKTLYEGKEKK